jgi:hypothetical protein
MITRSKDKCLRWRVIEVSCWPVNPTLSVSFGVGEGGYFMKKLINLEDMERMVVGPVKCSDENYTVKAVVTGDSLKIVTGSSLKIISQMPYREEIVPLSIKNLRRLLRTIGSNGDRKMVQGKLEGFLGYSI